MSGRAYDSRVSQQALLGPRRPRPHKIWKKKFIKVRLAACRKQKTQKQQAYAARRQPSSAVCAIHAAAARCRDMHGIFCHCHTSCGVCSRPSLYMARCVGAHVLYMQLHGAVLVLVLQVLIVGDSGLGKTTLVKTLLSTPGERLQVRHQQQLQVGHRDGCAAVAVVCPVHSLMLLQQWWRQLPQ